MFPLYPQYSAATTATVNDVVCITLLEMRWQPAIRTVPPYHDDPVYVNALANSVKEHLATLDFERLPEANPALVLDTRDLTINSVSAGTEGDMQEATFRLRAPAKILGSALEIDLPADATRVAIDYTTSPGASGLQWLEPRQTAGKRHPFLFSQAQAIHARSFVPLQDTPGVRMPYTAPVRTPPELLALMSADNDPQAEKDGEYQFTMRQPIPSYLLAIAVGDIEFKAMGDRTGVYAER